MADGDPSLVTKQEVIDPPSAKATLGLRLFFYRDIGAGSPFAIGPTLAYAGSSKASEFDPFSDKQIGRIECWLYYFPLATPANVRVAAAPYIDGYFKGRSDDDRRLDAGLLVQVKVGAPEFTY